MADIPVFKKRSVLITVIAGLIVIMAVVSAFWMVRTLKAFKGVNEYMRSSAIALNSQDQGSVEKPSEQGEAVPAADLEIAVGSAKEAFLASRPELDDVKTYEDLKAYVLKYGSSARKAEIATIEQYPEAYRDTMVSVAMSVTPPSSDIVGVEETIEGNRSTLVVLNGADAKWTVSMVYEGGEWKTDSEVWEKD